MRSKFDFYSDAGHGWLKVTRRELHQLGIHKLISGSSYAAGINVYLEEDADAQAFINAWEKKTGKEWSSSANVKDHASDRSRIRGYDGYVPMDDAALLALEKAAAALQEAYPHQKRKIGTAWMDDIQKWAATLPQPARA